MFVKSIKWSLCMWKMSHKLRLQGLLKCRQGGNQDLCFFGWNCPEWLLKRSVTVHICTWHGNLKSNWTTIYVCVFFHGWFIPSCEPTYALPTGIFESMITSFARLVGYGFVPWRVLDLKSQGTTSLLKPMRLGDNTDPESSRWLGQGMTTQNPERSCWNL